MSRLPVLMYHNVCEDEKNSTGLRISSDKLERQFQYLTEKNYSSFHLSELENASSIPTKSIVITFDDVTENQLFYAVPLLVKYNLKATFFVPFAYIGKANSWDEGEEKIMTIEQLTGLSDLVELGNHSYAHKKYATLTQTEINADFDNCFKVIAENKLKVYNAVAYPYGNYPKKGNKKSAFIAILKENKMKMGLRIGNRINLFPLKNPFEIMRIDIKGQDSLLKFKLKIRFGKLKLF